MARGIMTHQKLGVLLGLLLQLGLLVLAEAADGGGKESAGDAGGHCVRRWMEAVERMDGNRIDARRV